MGSANTARVKARDAESIDPIGPPSGPWCPLNGHGFTCPCRECSEFWGTAAGTMTHQNWMDHAYAVGDR